MQCLYCGGAFEYAGQTARCVRCLNFFAQENGQLRPVIVEPPGGGFNPAYSESFGKNLGFGPPPPGAVPQPPPQGQMQQPQHNLGQGSFDMGGGMRLKVKVDGKTPENFAKDKASSMIWGWIIGAIILGVIVLSAVGFGIYLFFAVKSGSSTGPSASHPGAPAKWDGKSTFTCSGNDEVTLNGVTANMSSTAIKASANCQLTLVGVNITAPVGIDASGNAKVKVTGGSVKSTTNSVVANNLAEVTFVGTTVTGKVQKAGLAKVSGAP